MDTIGLTLRSKSRRARPARPQISNPKPISGPLPANSKAAGPNVKPGPPKKTREQAASTTSDLVKRRYSTRFNQPPDVNSQVPPVPEVPRLNADYGKIAAPRSRKASPSPDPWQPIPVDLKALQDPSLPVDRCEFPDELSSFTLCPRVL